MADESAGAGGITGEARAFLDYATRAQLAKGDLLAGREWFEAAYCDGERTGDVAVMAHAVLGLGGLWVHERRGAAAGGLLRARLRHVLSRVDPACSDLRLRLRVRLAAETDFLAARHDTLLAVLEEARASPDPVAGLEALSLAHHCLLGPDHGERRRVLADEMVAEAARGGRRGELLMGLLWQVVDLLMDGDACASRRLRELRTALEEDEHLAIGFVVAAIDVMLAVRDGRLADAERLAQECRELGVKAGHPDALVWYGAHLVAIRWYAGRLPELLPMLADLVDSPALSAVDQSFSSALAAAAAAAGDHRAASRAVAALRGRDLAELPRSSSWLVTMYGIIEAAHLLGDAKASARAYELLEPYAERSMTAGLAVVCFGSTHHALGVACLTTGEVDRAVTHLRAAVQSNLGLGHWPALLASRLRYAEALTRRGGPNDLPAADSQWTMAKETGAALGLRVRTPTVRPRPPARPAACVRHGRGWHIALDGHVAFVNHSVGMLHLAVLIANPGIEIPAIELAAGADGLAMTARNSTMPPQPVLDHAAVHQYRQRLSQLDEMDGLESAGPERAARTRDERDWLLAELAASTNHRSQSRPFRDNTERARVAVSRAIRRTLATIECAEPAVAAQLRAGIHTGTRCWYRPV